MQRSEVIPGIDKVIEERCLIGNQEVDINKKMCGRPRGQQTSKE